MDAGTDMRNHFRFASTVLIVASIAVAGTSSVQRPSDLHPLLLVTNQGDRDLSIIDPAAAQQIAVIAENAVTGHEVAASPNGRTAYVPIYGNSGVGKPGTDGKTMLVIDLPSRKIVHMVDFGHGVRPHCAVYDRGRNLLYVTTELDKSVTIIDPKTLAITGSIPTGQAESHMLAISHNGRFGYTANVGPGTVSVLDGMPPANSSPSIPETWAGCTTSKRF
jgi:DNA-binding beta-propeller fold protein YncE